MVFPAGHHSIHFHVGNKLYRPSLSHVETTSKYLDRLYYVLSMLDNYSQ